MASVDRSIDQACCHTRQPFLMTQHPHPTHTETYTAAHQGTERQDKARQGKVRARHPNLTSDCDPIPVLNEDATTRAHSGMVVSIPSPEKRDEMKAKVEEQMAKVCV